LRREPYKVPGGTDGVRLISETDGDGVYTPVEQALLDAMLKWEPAGAALAAQMRQARVVERTLTGHGAWVEIQSHEPWNLSAPGECAEIDTVFYTPRDDAGLFAFAQFDKDGRATLDVCPTNGESYSCEECERLLYGDVINLKFHPYWPEPMRA